MGVEGYPAAVAHEEDCEICSAISTLNTGLLTYFVRNHSTSLNMALLSPRRE